jgi:hypothetical protein
MRILIVLGVLACGCSGADVFLPADGSTEGGGSSDGSSESSTGDSSSDAPLDGNGCMGRHPLVDAGARFCEQGDCYCLPNDKCLPMAVAQGCCNVPVKCY